MKKLLITLLLFNVLASYSMGIETKFIPRNLQTVQIYHSNNDSINEKDLIKKAIIKYYITGLQKRDFGLIRTICIKEAKLYGVRKDSSLNVISLDQWSKKFDPDTPPFKTLEYVIEKIDCEGTAAQVKILLIVNGKTKIYDFLNLLKIEGNWKIVNIIDY